MAVATNTLWVPLRPKASSPHSTGWTACAGRRCHAKAAVRPVELCSNWVTAEEQIARVAIWTGINIKWSERTGRLQLATISRETLDSRARTRAYS